METVVLNVQGMSCSHCEKAIKNAVGELEGVSDVAVSLDDATVTVKYGEGVSLDKIKQEIEGQGYEVV